jgi:hypothetical protein
MNLKYLLVSLALMAVPAMSSLKAECTDGDLEDDGSPARICLKERGDGRCNFNNDCCNGRECNSFGFCQDRS